MRDVHTRTRPHRAGRTMRLLGTRMTSHRSLCLFFLLLGLGCAARQEQQVRPEPHGERLIVRDAIAAIHPVANIGHRGAGSSEPNNPFPENSIFSFREAMAQGAQGIELDVELTSDGQLVAMHDDTLDRTTTCKGCVSAKTLAEIQQCRLRDGDGKVLADPPPTLEQSYLALPATALVNVELKVYGDDCRTPTTGPDDLAAAAVREVRRLGVGERTVFSSFDPSAAAAVRRESNYYSALLLGYTASADGSWPLGIARATELDLDAIHPALVIPPEGVRAAREAGLQVNVWTINRPAQMEAAIDAGVTAIITDRPAILVDTLRGLD